MANRKTHPAQIGRQVVKYLPGPRRWWDAVAERIVTNSKVQNLRGGWQELLEETADIVRPLVPAGGGGVLFSVGTRRYLFETDWYYFSPWYDPYFGWEFNGDVFHAASWPADAANGVSVSVVSVSPGGVVLDITFPATASGDGSFSVVGLMDGWEWGCSSAFTFGATQYERVRFVDGVWEQLEVLDDYASAPAWVTPTRWKYFPALNELRRVGLGGVVESQAAGDGWQNIKPGRWVSPGGKLFFEWVPV